MRIYAPNIFIIFWNLNKNLNLFTLSTFITRNVRSLLLCKLANFLERVASWTIREHQRFFGALVNAKNAWRPVPASASSRPRCLGHNRDREEGYKKRKKGKRIKKKRSMRDEKADRC